MSKRDAVAIRKICHADLPQLIRLCKDHAAYEHAEWVDNHQLSRWQVAFFSERPDLYGWVAETAGVLIGFMTVTVDYATWSASHFAHMDCLYLDADYRGAGLGRQFIDRLAQFCQERNYSHAQWQTPPDNAAGIVFYRRVGGVGKPKLRFFLDCPPPASPVQPDHQHHEHHEH